MWPVSGWPTGWPVAASHSRTVLSALPEAIRVPSGLNATLDTASGVAGQRLADGLAGGRVPQPHRLVVTAGDDARAVGAERHAGHRVRCGRSAAAPTGWPVAASHTRTVLSQLPETMRVPSGLNATLHTASVWPVSGWPTGWPVAASHSRTVLSALPETMRVPSGLNATLITASGVAGERLADGLAGGRVPQPHRLVVSCRRRSACRRG